MPGSESCPYRSPATGTFTFAYLQLLELLVLLLQLLSKLLQVLRLLLQLLRLALELLALLAAQRVQPQAAALQLLVDRAQGGSLRGDARSLGLKDSTRTAAQNRRETEGACRLATEGNLS